MMAITLRTALVTAGLSTLLSLVAIAPALAQVPPRLSDAEVAARLTGLPSWTLAEQQLQCTYRFSNFVEAVAFVNQIVPPAEAAGHHPDLTVGYGIVGVQLTTHDAGGLTRLDFEVAEAIARLSDRPCSP